MPNVRDIWHFNPQNVLHQGMLLLRASPSGFHISSYFTILKSYFINYTISFYNTSSIPNFYFPILLIKIIYLHNKIIFLHNKIIYPPITVIYSFFLILSVQHPQILQKTPSPHAHHRPPLLHYTLDTTTTTSNP